MKKIALIIAVAFVLAIGFQSCKTTADCPAYSKVNNQNTEVNA